MYDVAVFVYRITCPGGTNTGTVASSVGVRFGEIPRYVFGILNRGLGPFLVEGCVSEDASLHWLVIFGHVAPT